MAQYTEFLGITKLEPGQQQAHVVANEAFDNYDLAVAGMAEIDLAGKSAYSMSGRESTHAVLRFINSDRDCLVTIQARPNTWTMINDSVRAVRLRTDSSGSAPLTLEAGIVANVICDGLTVGVAINGMNQLEAHDQSPTAHGSLTANRTYYIRSGGSDQNEGLSAAAPLATVDAAKDRLRRLKTNGCTVTLDLGPGEWPAIRFTEGSLGDAASVVISGAGIDQTSVTSASGIAIALSNLSAGVTIQRLSLSAGNNCLDAMNVKRLTLNTLRFGECGAMHICLQLVSRCILSTGLVFAGSASTGVACAYMTHLRSNGLITMSNTPHFSRAFTTCATGSCVNWAGTTFSGTATGLRYRSENLGYIATGGGGANFFPGDQAGYTNTATGGLYA